MLSALDADQHGALPKRRNEKAVAYVPRFPIDAAMESIRKQAPANGAGLMRLSLTYVVGNAIVRERCSKENRIIEIPSSAIPGGMQLELDNVERWFEFATRAHNATKAVRGFEFEKPIAFFPEGNGTYWSLRYEGEILFSVQDKIRTAEKYLLPPIAGFAEMHAADVFHGHAFKHNMIVQPPYGSPEFVLIDPKFAYECKEHAGADGGTRQLNRGLTRADLARHDLYYYLEACRKMLGDEDGKSGSFERFLEKAQRAYERVNRVSGDLFNSGFLRLLGIEKPREPVLLEEGV